MLGCEWGNNEPLKTVAGRQEAAGPGWALWDGAQKPKGHPFSYNIELEPNRIQTQLLVVAILEFIFLCTFYNNIWTSSSPIVL
jgi:hypothetical protein